MEIVINIPDRIHYAIELGITVNGSDASQMLIDAVKKGTPLPQGHGRLIDISPYEEYFNTEISYDDGNHIHTKYTSSIPTIIEADKESK